MAGHSKVPWSKIFMYYISSEKVSYADCAKKFKVSESAVKIHGTAEQWVEKKQQAFKAAMVIMEERSAELIAQRNADHIKLAKSLLLGAAQQLATQKYLPDSARDIKDWIDTGVRIERQALGMDVKAGPAVKITDPKGQTYKITWGDGSSLEDY